MVNLEIGFAGKIYMQDVNNTVCNSVGVGTEGRLIDNRDNKVYWVGRLKDGLCWMTQNLAYDGGGEEVDISDFTTNNTAKYYSPGAYVYVGSSSSCDTTIGLSECTANGWKKLEDAVAYWDSTWSATDTISFYGVTSYIATDGITICNKEANSYFGDMDSDYIPCRIYYSPYYDSIVNDLHHLTGNYYNYNAATNNTAVSAASGNATGSVCPTGWSLPTSNNTDAGSFETLTSGISSPNSMRLAPYYFLASGIISNGKIQHIGYSTDYWSSTIDSTTTAYRMSFNWAGFNFSSSVRYLGASVRCVAK